MHLLRALAACCVVAASTARAAPSIDVLVLFSNDRLVPANIEVDRGLREEIGGRKDRNVHLFTEFLDQPSFSGADYERTVADYLQEKYATRPPQVIVVGGDQALEFLLRHRADLFPSAPVVHLGVAKRTLLAHQPLPGDIVGVAADIDAPGTIQLALRLHPNTRRIVIVTGASELDRERENGLRKQIASMKLSQEIEFIVGLQSDDLAKRLADLGSGDVVYTPGYFRDGAGREFSPRDSAAFMAAASAAAVYGPYISFIGTGVVGGRVPDFAEMGREAAMAVNGLLDGVAPADLHLPAIAAARINVDWRQVIRWDIDPKSIPADAVLQFKEPTFWEAYRDKAIMIAAVIIV